MPPVFIDTELKWNEKCSKIEKWTLNKTNNLDYNFKIFFNDIYTINQSRYSVDAFCCCCCSLPKGISHVKRLMMFSTEIDLFFSSSSDYLLPQFFKHRIMTWRRVSKSPREMKKLAIIINLVFNNKGTLTFVASMHIF